MRGPVALQEFDYVVVGAGSAGCVVAARLAEDGQSSVLLMEAGGRDWSPWIHLPIGYGKLFNNPRFNWMNESEPEPGLHGRAIFQPRGKVLGGTGSINGMLYIRGQAEDYNHWRDLGNAGWSFEDVLPWFRHSERQVHGASAFHGNEGPMWVSDQPQRHALADAFIAAARECGVPQNDDFNGPTQEGAGYLQTTTHRSVRWSSAKAYLRPLRRRGNLKVITGAQATRIVLRDRCAVGVDYVAGGTSMGARARREVIVCAGAFNTPQLLQVSGIGPARALSERGISVLHDLPGVGRNLHDHFRTSMVCECSQPVTHNDTMRGPLRMTAAALQYALTRRGPMATGLYAGGFFRSSPAIDRPDLQVTTWPSSLKRRDAKGVELHDFSGFTMNAIVVRPKSRGEVMAKCGDVRTPPAIRMNYLDAPEDVDIALKGMKWLRRLANTPSLQAYVAREHAPGRQVLLDNELIDYMRSTGGSTFHAVGSCRMGSDALSVVDNELRVRGLQGLRIADASVMPTIPSGNTNAPVVMIAERAADFCQRDERRQNGRANSSTSA